MGTPDTLLWSWGKTPSVQLVRYRRVTEAVQAVHDVYCCHLLVGMCIIAIGLAGLAHADPGWIDEVKLGVLAHDIRFWATMSNLAPISMWRSSSPRRPFCASSGPHVRTLVSRSTWRAQPTTDISA
jgi:hypothetical protein